MTNTTHFFLRHEKPGYKETHKNIGTTASLKPGDSGSPIGGLTLLPVGMSIAQDQANGDLNAIVDALGNFFANSITTPSLNVTGSVSNSGNSVVNGNASVGSLNVTGAIAASSEAIAGASTAASYTATGAATAASFVSGAPGSAASVGAIGEIITSVLAVGSAVSLTTTQAKTITSIVLTPGSWDVAAMVDFAPAGTTTIQDLLIAISTSNNATDGTQDAAAQYPFAVIAGALLAPILPSPTRRILVASGTQTVYVVAQADFSVSTMTAYGSITARRAH